jgi:hypothetical protein
MIWDFDFENLKSAFGIRAWGPDVKVHSSVTDPGSGAFLNPWIRDPRWVKNQDQDPGSEMNIPDHISESLETSFWVKILKFFDADLDPGILFDPGTGMEKIRIRDKHPGSATLVLSICILLQPA